MGLNMVKSSIPNAPSTVFDSSFFAPVLTLSRRTCLVLLLAFSLFALVAALSQCLCSEAFIYQLNFTVFMYVTRISRYI
jgi:hypothetical protein